MAAENIQLYWIRGLFSDTPHNDPDMPFAGYFILWQIHPNSIKGRLVDAFGPSEIFGGAHDEIFGLRILKRYTGNGMSSVKYNFHTKDGVVHTTQNQVNLEMLNAKYLQLKER